MSVTERNVNRRTAIKTGVAVAASFLFPSAEAFSREKESLDSLVQNLFNKPGWNPTLNSRENKSDAIFFQKIVEKWKRHYLGYKGKNNLLFAGWKRLLANDGKDLRMIQATAKKYGVPFDVVFLALAESHWNDIGENFAKAAGYWQFIPTTAAAKPYSLKNVPVERKQKKYSREELKAIEDQRLDPVASTDAAIRYLKDLYNQAKGWKQKYGTKSTEDDLWAYAFWSYNRGPGHVKKTFRRQGGLAIKYPSGLLKESNSAPRRESANYVPKIIAIREVLKHLHGNIKPVNETKRTDDSEPPSLINNLVERFDTLLESADRDTVLQFYNELFTESQKNDDVNIQNEIDKLIKELQKKYPKYFSVETSRFSSNIDPQSGDTVTRIKGAEEDESDIENVEYKIQPGDNLTKLAIWLSPNNDRKTIREIREFIFALNPEIAKNPNLLVRGKKINIPAQIITIKDPDLIKIASQYYPGWKNTDVIVKMIKWLNGIRGDVIRPGDELYVALPLK